VNRFYTYGVLARLAALAAALELERDGAEGMNLLFIADPLAAFKTYKDSTYAMMVEAARRGHEIWTHAGRRSGLARRARSSGRAQRIATGG
jgi:hypothetical protein